MTRRILFLLIFCFALPFLFCKAQNIQKIDSLNKVLNNNIVDTEKVNTLNILAFEYLYSEPDKSLKHVKEAYLKATDIFYTKGIGKSLNGFGNYYFNQGNYDTALVFYNRALKIQDSIGEKKLSAICLNNIGMVYHLKGEYNKTIEYYNRSLKIREEIKDKKGVSDCMNNIGVVFMDQGNYSKALEYYFKTLNIKNELGDKRGIASILSNIGVTYSYKSELSPDTKNNDLNLSITYLAKALKLYIEMGNIKGIADCQINMCSKYFALKKYDESLKWAKDAMSNYEKIKDIRGVSTCYIDISDIYVHDKDYVKAIEYLYKSLNQRKEIGDKMGTAECYFKLGKIHNELEKYNLALDYFNKYLQLSKEMESIEDLRRCYEHLSLIHSKLNNYKKAFEYQVLFKQMQDSIINSDNTKKITQLEMNFEFEQKEREQTLIQQQKDAVKTIELKKQKLIKNAFIAGFILTLIFSFFIFRSYRINKKKNIILAAQKNEILEKNFVLYQQNEEITAQRDEIETQKDEIVKQHNIIEVKNKNITDSIRYAQQIQQAIHPKDELIKTHLPHSFIFLKPKDIVSGDFYWVSSNEDQNIVYFSAVDCTGHGVPGAFMSIVGHNLLKQALNEQKLTSPSQIIDFISKNIYQQFRKQNESDTNYVKDGMDLALCKLNKEKLLLEYAGVHNPLYLIRNKQLTEYKADNYPIGEPFCNDFLNYTNQHIYLQKEDVIYIFSDGFIDQFGGEKRKKFLNHRFKQTLLDLHSLPMEEQKTGLEKILTEWKGMNEQIDDILIMGVKI